MKSSPRDLVSTVGVHAGAQPAILAPGRAEAAVIAALLVLAGAAGAGEETADAAEGNSG
jgi:hypothetical protein